MGEEKKIRKKKKERGRSQILRRKKKTRQEWTFTKVIYSTFTNALGHKKRGKKKK